MNSVKAVDSSAHKEHSKNKWQTFENPPCFLLSYYITNTKEF